MTQELGTVRAVDGDLDYSKYPIGSMLYLYPWHVSILWDHVLIILQEFSH